jgi:parvulin-like peptidyl-prolyl isomerase
VETGSVRPKRSVRHAQEAAQRPRPAPNRRHLTKQQRERRLQRLVVGGAVIVVLLAILIPAYGYWREVLRQGDMPVATIDGTPMTAEMYARYAGTRQTLLTRQVVQLQQIANPPNAKSTDKPTPDQQAAQRQLQTLQSEASNLQVTALSDAIEARLLLDESKTRNLIASQAELDDALRWILSPPQAGTSATPGSGIAAVPTPLQASGLISLDEAKQAQTQIVGKGRYLSADQFTELIVKPAVLKAKLVAALAPNVPTTEEEVHARHILVKTKDEADAIEKQLKDGADFATVAKDKSTDTGSKDKGGDLGWFGKGVMVPEFEKAAFSLNPGQISEPVQSSFGFHIIQAVEKDPNHPLDPQRLQQLRTQPYQQWLSQATANQQKVQYSSSQSQMTWVSSYLQQGN